MQNLDLVWLISLALSGLSVVAFLGLILRRGVVSGREAREASARDSLKAGILRYLEAGADLEGIRSAVRGKSSLFMSDLTAELLQVSKGEDRRRLTELLHRLDVVELHIAASREGNPYERIAAIAGLSLFHEPRAEDAIRANLDAGNPDVRLAAAWALSALGAIRSLPDLVERLRIGTEETSRSLRKIFRNLVPGQTDQLILLLQDDVPDFAKELAIDALARSGDRRAAVAVAAMSGHEAENLRSTALRALADLGYPEAAPFVLRALTDASGPVRAMAALCAGRIGLREAVPLLGDGLDDDFWWARLRSAQALCELGEAGIEILEEASGGAGSTGGDSRAFRIAGQVLAERESAG